jgi:regulator of protease activity HflC (stomatin/prohibitin superfamily)
MSRSSGILADSFSSINPVTMATAGAVASGIVIRLGFVTKIEAGHIGMRTRNGKPRIRDGEYRTVGPGIRFRLPTHALKVISVQGRPNELPQHSLGTSDGKQIIAPTSIIWRVNKDPQSVYSALYKTEGDSLAESVVKIASAGLGSAIRSMTSAECLAESSIPIIGEHIKHSTADRLGVLGVELTDVLVEGVAETPSEVFRSTMSAFSDGATLAGTLYGANQFPNL